MSEELKDKNLTQIGGGVETLVNDSNWRTIAMYKKFKIVHNLKLDTEYNIESLTGTKFKKCNCFYSITKFKSLKTLKYHLEIEHIINYPKIIFKNKHTQYSIEAELSCIFFEYGGELFV